MPRASGPTQTRRMVAEGLLAAVVTYDAVLRGSPLEPDRPQVAILGLAEAWRDAADHAPEQPIPEPVDLFGGALENSLALARAATPADRQRAMGLAEFVYRLGPLTTMSGLGETWTAAAGRLAPPRIVAIAARGLPRPELHGSASRTRLLALAALGRAAQQARAPLESVERWGLTDLRAERIHRLRELHVAERRVDTLLAGCPSDERSVTLTALAHARHVRRALLLTAQPRRSST